MAFESLTDRLAGVFKKLKGHGKLSEADIKAAMREVRMALLEADVNYKVAKDFCSKVSERAMGQEVMESPDPRPAGGQDRQRGADRPHGRRGSPPPVYQEQGPDRFDALRPAGQRQDHPRRQAGQVLPQAGPPAAAGGLRYLPPPPPSNS